jgi:hypothetical protein
VISACAIRVNMWDAPTCFSKHTWHLLTTKTYLSLCRWKHSCVLFFWGGTCWWWMDSLVIFLLVFQLQSLLFWFLIFLLGFFVKVLFVFNYILQFQSDIIFYNLILILLIFIFFLGPFIKILFVFNFIIQSKFIVYY